MHITDAEILCRKTPYGDVCEWKGGKFAEVNCGLFDGRIKRGQLLTLGRLKVRVVVFPTMNSIGYPCDHAQVILESPQAQLYWLYRERAESLIRLILNIEVRIHGLMLKPYESKVMPFTKWVADCLLS